MVCNFDDSHFKSIDTSEIYAHLHRQGMFYGSDFRTLKRVQLKEKTLILQLLGSEDSRGHHLDCTILDGVFQGIAAFALQAKETGLYLGFSIEHVQQEGHLQGSARAFIQKKKTLHSSGLLLFDIYIESENGRLQLENFAIKKMAVPSNTLLWNNTWEPLLLKEAPLPDAVSVFFKDNIDDAFALCNALYKRGIATVLGPIPYSQLNSSMTTAALSNTHKAIFIDPDERIIWQAAQQLQQYPNLPIYAFCEPSVASLLQSFGAEQKRQTCAIVSESRLSTTDMVEAIGAPRV